MILVSGGEALDATQGAQRLYDEQVTHVCGFGRAEEFQSCRQDAYTLMFTEAERGKHIYIALAWQNEKGCSFLKGSESPRDCTDWLSAFYR